MPFPQCPVNILVMFSYTLDLKLSIFLTDIKTLIFAIVEKRVCANSNSFADVICFCVLSSSPGFEGQKYSHLVTIPHPELFVSYIVAMVAIFPSGN
jgi:hypothetical protein